LAPALHYQCRIVPFFTALGALTLAFGAAAQAAPSAAPPEPAPPGSPAAAEALRGECFPACREGFVCSESRCVSLCNPPCPDEQTCVGGVRCEPRAPGGVHEPPPPRRVSFEERGHSMAAFHYGFPSNVLVNDEDGPRDSVLGANLRSDVPVAGYMLVGPMFEFGSYEPGYYFDLDVYLRARVPIDAKKVQFQIWAGVPVGLTFSFLSGDFARTLEGFALGWNVGVLLGGAVHFTREFGLFTEGGWQQHKMSHDRTVGGGDVDLVLKPWIWNVGFVFRG
jgi:hypothetical protein